MGGCENRGEGRVWAKGRWEDVGAGEMKGCGSRVDGRVL